MKIESLKSQVDEREWQTRVDVAACYRLIARYGMSDLVYNHITARVPGTADEFLINPYGMLYEEITASSLHKIDLDGNILQKPATKYGINHAGYVIHSAVHAARHDVECVIHTHTRANMAVSCLEQGLMPLTQASLRFYGRISYHDFEGPAVEPDERVRLVEDLGTTDVMLLRNHGALTCGRTVGEAFLLMQRLENACKVQVDVLSMQAPLHMPSEESMLKTARVLGPPTVERQGNEAKMGTWSGAMEWEALLRQLDRTDSSFRD
ncbi:MAG: class II aldolase/adducin family protein [Janthinobacterium lividum]